MRNFVVTCVLGGSCALASTQARGGAVTTLVGIDIVGGNRLIEIDPATGATRLIGPCGVTGTLNGLAYDARASLLYAVDAGSDSLLTVDALTGSATSIGSLASAMGSSGGAPEIFTNVNALAMDPRDGILFGADIATESLLRIDPSTASAERIAFFTGVREVEGLAFDPVSRTLYGLSADQSRLVAIDPATGIATPIGSPLPGAIWRGLEFDPATSFLFASAGNRLYRINPGTGVPALVGVMPSVGSVQGLAIVPGPGTVAVIGIAGLTLLARRRHHRYLGRFASPSRSDLSVLATAGSSAATSSQATCASRG